ncbi:hypothetical protein Skr01_65340 [Sphaerisporangium krabiense]|uniref:Uncharacterized protein n=1 Tax=Sphaerisporangium krabiense TaxID=763782 RepID=A0A7W9DP27_9ACTN|nr:hypothetical protein [Sphaerisporangium krabiense]MBB5624850.1 hypothetical protein [Sphaerisporangium krabiense]GII66449.1 hypothetical protein Skr01_65340 [Sphaerisporangium krabiense]
MRHRTDWLSLLCGLLFVGIGVLYLTGTAPDMAVMALVLVAGLGLAGFVAVLAKAVRKR